MWAFGSSPAASVWQWFWVLAFWYFCFPCTKNVLNTWWCWKNVNKNIMEMNVLLWVGTMFLFVTLPHSFVPLEPLHHIGCKSPVLAPFDKTPCLSVPQTKRIGWELDRGNYRDVVFACFGIGKRRKWKGAWSTHYTIFTIHHWLIVAWPHAHDDDENTCSTAISARVLSKSPGQAEEWETPRDNLPEITSNYEGFVFQLGLFPT